MTGTDASLAALVANIPVVYREYVSLENSAQRILHHQVLLVPGLLQTEAYARWVVQGLSPASATAAERGQRVELRMARQAGFFARGAPHSVVIWECALNRVPGSWSALRDQVAHLLKVSRWPDVQIQIVPLGSSRVYYGDCDAFILLEGLDGEWALFRDHSDLCERVVEPDIIVAYRAGFEQAQEAALTVPASREWLELRLDELSGGL